MESSEKYQAILITRGAAVRRNLPRRSPRNDLIKKHRKISTRYLHLSKYYFANHRRFRVFWPINVSMQGTKPKNFYKKTFYEKELSRDDLMRRIQLFITRCCLWFSHQSEFQNKERRNSVGFQWHEIEYDNREKIIVGELFVLISLSKLRCNQKNLTM